jgi:hypothetical protein
MFAHLYIIILKTERFTETNAVGTKCVLHLTVQLLLLTFFTPINILQVVLKTYAETYRSLHFECPIFVSDFNKDWNMPTRFSRTPQYQIS